MVGSGLMREHKNVEQPRDYTRLTLKLFFERKDISYVHAAVDRS